MASLLDLLIIYYVAKRYSNRAYGSASNRYVDGLEQMRRVREIARKARERRENGSAWKESWNMSFGAQEGIRSALVEVQKRCCVKMRVYT